VVQGDEIEMVRGRENGEMAGWEAVDGDGDGSDDEGGEGSG